MTTSDPFANPPRDGQQPPASPSAQSAQWSPAPAPEQGHAAPQGQADAPAQQGYVERTYDGGAQGYAAPVAQPPQPAAPQPSYGASSSAQPSYQSSYGSSSSGGTDGVSIAALVTGILGLGFVATILGAVGLRRTADGARSGTGMAWAGVILGILGTIVWTAVVTGAIVGAAGVADSIDWDSGVVSDGETYGDDPYLDGLWDDCAAGDNGACDDLYNESPLFSEYEEFGDTCGGRGRTGTWCDG